MVAKKQNVALTQWQRTPHRIKDADASHSAAIGNIDGDASVQIAVVTEPADGQDFTLEAEQQGNSPPLEIMLDDDDDLTLPSN